MGDANFATGSKGLIAVDKVGNQILFLDLKTYVTTLTLDAFAPRVHELVISPDHRTAYVPIYGDGIHGNNPHPGHLIALFDLVARRHAGDFSTYPYLAPHGLRWGPQGQFIRSLATSTSPPCSASSPSFSSMSRWWRSTRAP